MSDDNHTPVAETDDVPPAIAGDEHDAELSSPAAVDVVTSAPDHVSDDSIGEVAISDIRENGTSVSIDDTTLEAGEDGHAGDEGGLAPAADDAAPVPPENSRRWYVVKVQSGREETIKAAIERKVKIEGLEEFYGQIAVPVEEYVEKKKVSVKDKKTGQKVTQEKNVIKYRKKFQGYIFAEVEFNDRILYLFRETSGVGDFVGAAGPMKPPPPMSENEVRTMLTGVVGKEERGNKNRKIKVKLDFEKGDKVRIKDGAFAGSEGEVKSITEPKDPADTPKVTVIVTIWGRPVELEELDYWHVDKL